MRDAEVAGVWAPTRAPAEALASQARALGVGEARVHASVAEMVADPAVDAICICSTNGARVAVVEEIADALVRGRGALRGVACEKPLARNVREARRMVELIEAAEVAHGYLENQVFAPSVVRGKEIIWRRAAALFGSAVPGAGGGGAQRPHMAWFWDGARQGGGVLNDMLCHSAREDRDRDLSYARCASPPASVNVGRVGSSLSAASGL